MKSFKNNDIIVRIYDKSNRKSICIYNAEKSNILYLDKTFKELGGLSQFNSYGLGYTYSYRYANLNELNYILNVLKNTNTNTHQYYSIVKNFKNNLRIEKIEKLKQLNKINDI